jgi:hypothetical protein
VVTTTPEPTGTPAGGSIFLVYNIKIYWTHLSKLITIIKTGFIFYKYFFELI